MRILHLIPHLSGGGAEQQLYYLASELAARGHEVHVAALKEGPDPKDWKEKNVIIHKVSSFNNYDPRIFFQILKLAKKIKPDFIQTWIVQMDILGGIAAIFTKIPWVLREPSLEQCYPNSWKIRLRKFLGNFCKVIIPNSSGGYKYWQAHDPKIALHIIPNGFPLEKISLINSELYEQIDPESKKKYILYAGRLAEGKNLDNFIKALSIVNNEKKIMSFICGDGPLRRHLFQLIVDAGLKDLVKITGFIAPEKLWSMMKGAGLFVFVSEYEGFPNVVMEAAASNCPLVLSDIPAHREFFDDTTAWLVDPYEPQKIANAILHGLNNPQEAKLKAGKVLEQIQRYSIQNMTNAYEDVYQKVLHQTAR